MEWKCKEKDNKFGMIKLRTKRSDCKVDIEENETVEAEEVEDEVERLWM
jgi:hypothetical protein